VNNVDPFSETAVRVMAVLPLINPTDKAISVLNAFCSVTYLANNADYPLTVNTQVIIGWNIMKTVILLLLAFSMRIILFLK
jgi:hypothetical protein